MKPVRMIVKDAIVGGLLLATAAAIGVTIQGASLLYENAKIMSSATHATENALQQALVEATVEPALVTGEPAALAATPGQGEAVVAVSPQKPPGGGATLEIFAPKEHKVALYDGLTGEHLRWGVARVAESASPGTAGNCVIYGHRDSAFRCLKGVAVGDPVILTTKEAKFAYTVVETQRCLPEDVRITQTYDSAYLTLVTCYPFVYSGPAQERYLVICKLSAITEL